MSKKVIFEHTDPGSEARAPRVVKLFRGSPAAAEIWIDAGMYTGNEPPSEEKTQFIPYVRGELQFRPESGPRIPRQVRLPTKDGPAWFVVRRCSSGNINSVTGLCKDHDCAHSIGSRFVADYTAKEQCEAVLAYRKDVTPVQIGRVSIPVAPGLEASL